MELRPGTRLKSTVCTTEAIVVKAPDTGVDVRCGGAPMVDAAAGVESTGQPAGDARGGTLMGKRYVDGDESLELLCTKPGDGSLGVGDDLLVLKESKPLPASD